MAVIIVGRLAANPGGIRLNPPETVRLTQSLRTNTGAAENVQIVYNLDPSHNVWFSTPQGPFKSIQFVRDVPAAPQNFFDDVTFIQAPGAVVDVFEIVQNICDPACRMRDIVTVHIII
ncbi:MAG TPA: hypothetical protein VF179_17655 [Thermoanaerobaculia bacterium]|nr:hypothetical protein [Thermoanaerobaculia bacterium]